METKDTIEGITSQFHHDEGGIYLDYNATTPVLPAVWQKAAPYLTEHFGNPSSSHWAGHTPKEAIYRARTQVAMLIGACPEQIIFTSGGTEANYLALWGVLRDSDGGLILSSTIEHPAVSDPIQQLCSRNWHHQTLAVDTSEESSFTEKYTDI